MKNEHSETKIIATYLWQKYCDKLAEVNKCIDTGDTNYERIYKEQLQVIGNLWLECTHKLRCNK